jgi:ferredoxin
MMPGIILFCWLCFHHAHTQERGWSFVDRATLFIFTILSAMQKHIIAFFSPAGSTRLVAETLSHRLSHNHCDNILIDLGKRKSIPWNDIQSMATHGGCLWIGSPVYCDHAVPLILEFIQGLPRPSSPCFAVPFATWGGVTSGLALPEMAQLLQTRAYSPIGAAKILAVHSSMWRVAQPLALGHPGRADMEQLEMLVDKVTEILKQQEIVPLTLDLLEYLSPSLRAEATQKSLEAAKKIMPPPVADEQLCQPCGVCAEACPVEAIALNPFPVINQTNCVLCLQCVRSCPRQAFPFDADQVAARITAMAAKSDEEKVTAIFHEP